MAFGGEFYGDNGKIQIAAGVSNFFMREKGVITLGTSANSISITPSLSYDSIAVYGDTGGSIMPKAIFPSVVAGGTSQTFNVKNNTGAISAPTGAKFYWYAFRNYNSLSPATSGYGMEIYNDDGTVGFSSTEPKIMKGFKLPITSAATINTTVSSDRVYAAIQYGTSRGSGTYIEPMGGETATGGRNPTIIRDSSTNLAVVFSRPRNTPVAGPDNFTGGFIILDVTNY